MSELLGQISRAGEASIEFDDDTVTISGDITQVGAETELNSAIEAATQTGLRIVDNTVELDLAAQTTRLDEKIKNTLLEAQEEALQAEIGQTKAFFELADSALTPTGKSVLDKVAVSLKQYPLPPVLIVGHTDQSGTPDSNLVLSSNRAKAAAQHLVDTGARAATDLLDLGRGEKDLADIDPTGLSDIELSKKQRRIDFVVGQASIDQTLARQ